MTYWLTVSVPGSTTAPSIQLLSAPSLTAVGPVRSTNGATLFTVTLNVPEVLPPSSSVTITVTVYSPLSAYVCVPPSAPAPMASKTVVFSVGLPSPQLTVAVCVSSKPGSINNPSAGAPPCALRSSSWPSFSVWSVAVTNTGGKLLTSTLNVPEALPPSSSVTLTVTVYVPLSAYVCVPPSAP